MLQYFTLQKVGFGTQSRGLSGGGGEGACVGWDVGAEKRTARSVCTCLPMQTTMWQEMNITLSAASNPVKKTRLALFRVPSEGLRGAFFPRSI